MSKNRKMSLVALFAALMAVGSQIAVPIGPVPFTMQVFFVFLSGMMLGPRLGMMAQTVYLLLGIIGFPAFAQFGSGIGILFGPTGGFLLAFPITAYLAGMGKTKIFKILFSIAGLAVIYVFGWIRLGIYLGDFQKSFIAGVLPFVGFDFLKIWMALFAALSLKKAFGNIFRHQNS